MTLFDPACGTPVAQCPFLELIWKDLLAHWGPRALEAAHLPEAQARVELPIS